MDSKEINRMRKLAGIITEGKAPDIDWDYQDKKDRDLESRYRYDDGEDDGSDEDKEYFVQGMKELESGEREDFYFGEESYYITFENGAYILNQEDGDGDVTEKYVSDTSDEMADYLINSIMGLNEGGVTSSGSGLQRSFGETITGSSQLFMEYEDFEKFKEDVSLIQNQISGLKVGMSWDDYLDQNQTHPMVTFSYSYTGDDVTVEEKVNDLLDKYSSLYESTMVTKSTDSSQIADIARREKTDTATVQSAVNQAKQTNKPININESNPLTKFLRKLGWLGDSWTPQEYKTQVRKLPDDILLNWYESKGNPIPNTPLDFQINLVKSEMERRGLIKNNINETFKKNMKKSEFKKFLKEEIKSNLGSPAPTQMNEMAAIKGDIKTLVDKLIADNPEMEVPALSRLIMKDAEINTIIDRDNLSDMAQNQTQKYIRLARGERELGQRGRKADPNKPSIEPKVKKVQTGPTAEQMIQDLEGADDLAAEDAKWKGKFKLLSNSALKEIWSQYFGDSAPAGDEAPLNEMAKIQGSLADAIGAVLAQAGDDIDSLALKKQIKSDPDVIAALGSETLYDNQLNKFISLSRGDRELGQRGRKAGGQNQPKTNSTPKSSLAAMVDGDDDVEVEDNWNKIDTDFDDDNDDDKIDAQAASAASSTSSVDSERGAGLKEQETKKFWKAFIGKMKEEGIISADNKPIDRDALESKRAEAKKELAEKLKGLK